MGEDVKGVDWAMSEIDNARNGALHDLKWLSAAYRTHPECVVTNSQLDPSKIKLYRIDEITYEKGAPREEALANVFTTVAIPGINILYLLVGDDNGVKVFFGVAEDATQKLPSGLRLADIGDDILCRSIRGNFRGSTITPVVGDGLWEVIFKVFPSEGEDVHDSKSKDGKNSVFYRTMDGVPGLTKDKDAKTFQGMDRLMDVMLGDQFALMFLIKPIVAEGREMAVLEKNLDEVYRKLTWAAKCHYQYAKNSGTNKGISFSHGISDGVSEGVNNSKSQSDTSNWTDQIQKTSSAKSVSESGGWSQQYGLSMGENFSVNTGTSQQISRQSGDQNGESRSWGNEIVYKHVQSWLKYFDDLIYPRLDRAKGRGMFVVSTLLSATKASVMTKLANTMKAIYSGIEGNMVPFRDEELPIGGAKFASLSSLQQPIWTDVETWSKENEENDEKNDREFSYARSKCAQIRIDGKSVQERFYDGTWMSTSALSHLSGLPTKEVVGVKLREEVEFGLNADSVESNDAVKLGCLVQGGEVQDIAVQLKKSEFDRHIFVAGVTGSGKTTTCQQLLCACVKDNHCKKVEDQNHFLVIEPAKTEYRSLLGSKYLLGEDGKSTENELLVFTIGDEIKGSPFRLNPLEFSEGESISSRVDMLMASMQAAFEMEAAIPQILESAIYRAYEDYGWDKNTNQNAFYPGSKAYEPGVYAFPRLSDVVQIAVERVGELFPGEDKRLRDEYVGSIRARLEGLLVGSKGQMLDCKRSMNFEDLLDRNVVFELEEIRNGQQKALIIGFILTNLSVAIKRKFDRHNKKIGHITLIEEAHRLMSRYEPGDDPNKRMAVETFADMLAEVRKYGESIIIADQIPNKLTPDVLKNTNVKIAHRIFAQDDKDAIGATMSLTDEQKGFLSNLKIGHAIAFSGNWSKAVHVCVPHEIDTSNQRQVTNATLRKRAFEYLAMHFKQGVLPGFECLGSVKVAEKKIEDYWRDVQTVEFDGVFEEISGVPSDRGVQLKTKVKRAIETCGIDVVATALTARYLMPDRIDLRVEAAKKALEIFAAGKVLADSSVRKLISLNK